MTIRKEIRDERTDVIGFYNLVKKLNDTQTEIIEVEEQFKETTLQGLLDEIKAKNESITQLQEQIVAAQNELVTLNEMLELANSLMQIDTDGNVGGAVKNPSEPLIVQ